MPTIISLWVGDAPHCGALRRPRSEGRKLLSAVVLLVAIVASIVVAGLIAPDEPNTGFTDAAAVIAFAGLAAVAIERLIEGLFTLLAGPLGQWWPLSVVKKEFDDFEDQTEELLGPLMSTAIATLEAGRELAAGAGTSIAAYDSALASMDATRQKLSAQFSDARTKLAPGSSRLARVAAVADGADQVIRSAFDTAGIGADAAAELLEATHQVTDRALLIIGSFEDNPARRLASLGIGAALGSLVSGGVGLNLFAATLTDPGAAASETGTVVALLLGTVGVVVTGVFIGLGSAPTHELVKALQTYKKGRVGPVVVPAVGGSVPTISLESARFAMLVQPTERPTTGSLYVQVRRTD